MLRTIFTDAQSSEVHLHNFLQLLKKPRKFPIEIKTFYSDGSVYFLYVQL